MSFLGSVHSNSLTEHQLTPLCPTLTFLGIDKRQTIQTDIVSPKNNNNKLTLNNLTKKRDRNNDNKKRRRYFIEGLLTDAKPDGSQPGSLSMNDYLAKLHHMTDAPVVQPPSPMATMKAFNQPLIDHPIVHSPLSPHPINNLVAQKPSIVQGVAKHFVGGAGIEPPFGQSQALPWPSLKEHSFDDDKIKALNFHYGQDESQHHNSVNLGKIPSWSKCGMEHPCINYGRVAPVQDPKEAGIALKSSSFDSPAPEQFHVGFDHHYNGETYVDLDHLLHNGEEISHYVHDHDQDHDRMISGKDDENEDEIDSKKYPGYTIKHHWSDPLLDIAHIEHHDIRPDLAGPDTRTEFPPTSKEPKFAGSGDDGDEEKEEEDEDEHDPHFPFDHDEHHDHVEFPDNVQHLDHDEDSHGEENHENHVDGYHLEENHHSPHEPIHSIPAAHHYAGAGASGFHFDGYHADHAPIAHGDGGYMGDAVHGVGLHVDGNQGNIGHEGIEDGGHFNGGGDIHSFTGDSHGIGQPSGHIELGGGVDTFVDHGHGHSEGGIAGHGGSFGSHIDGTGHHFGGGHFEGGHFGGSHFEGNHGSFEGDHGSFEGNHGSFDGDHGSFDGTGHNFGNNHFEGGHGSFEGGHGSFEGGSSHFVGAHGGHAFEEDESFHGGVNGGHMGGVDNDAHHFGGHGDGFGGGEGIAHLGGHGISHGHEHGGGGQMHVTAEQNIYGDVSDSHTIHKGSSEAIHINAEDSDDAKSLNKVLKTVNVHTDGQGHFYDESMHKAVDSTAAEDEKYGVKVNKLVKASEDKALAGIEKDAEEAVKAEDEKMKAAAKKPKNDKEKFDAQLEALDDSLKASPEKPDGGDKEDDGDDKKKPVDVGGKGDAKADDKLIQKIWAQIGSGGGEKPKKNHEVTTGEGREIKPDDDTTLSGLKDGGDFEGNAKTETEMEADVLRRISAKLGKGDADKGAVLLGKLLGNHTSPPQSSLLAGIEKVAEKQEHLFQTSKDEKDSQKSGDPQKENLSSNKPLSSQVEEGSRKTSVLSYQKELLFKMEAKILDGIALRLGRGDGKRGAFLLSRLMNEGVDISSESPDIQGSRKDELPTPSWYRFTDFVQEIRNGKGVNELLPVSAESLSNQRGDDSGESSWFPLTMFKGFDESLKLPFLPYSIKRNGRIGVEEPSSGSKKSGQYSMPVVRNPYGGMVFLAGSQGSTKNGPYLVDHWGHAVDLSKRDFPGFLLTSRSSKKSYLYVPINSMTGQNDTGDAAISKWSDRSKVVLTPKGPMTLGNLCGKNNIGDDGAKESVVEEKRDVIKGKQGEYYRGNLISKRKWKPSDPLKGDFVDTKDDETQRTYIPMRNKEKVSTKQKREERRRSYVPMTNEERTSGGLSTIKKVTHPQMVVTPSKDETGKKRALLFKSSSHSSSDVSAEKRVLVPLNTVQKYKNVKTELHHKNVSSGQTASDSLKLDTHLGLGELMSPEKRESSSSNTGGTLISSGMKKMNGSLEDRKKRQMHVRVSHEHTSYGALHQDRPHFASDDFLNGTYIEAEPLHSSDGLLGGYSSFHDGSPESLYHARHTYQGETQHVYQSDIGGEGHINFGNDFGHSPDFGHGVEEGDNGHSEHHEDREHEDISSSEHHGGEHMEEVWDSSHGSIESGHGGGTFGGSSEYSLGDSGHGSMESGGQSLGDSGHGSMKSGGHSEHESNGDQHESKGETHHQESRGSVLNYARQIQQQGYGHITEDHPDFSHSSEHLTFTHGPLHSEIGNIGLSDYHGVNHETKGHYVSSLGGTTAHVGFGHAQNHNDGAHYGHSENYEHGEFSNFGHAGTHYHSGGVLSLGGGHNGGDHYMHDQHLGEMVDHHTGGGSSSHHDGGHHGEEQFISYDFGHHGGDLGHEDLSTPSGDMCLHEYQHHHHLGNH